MKFLDIKETYYKYKNHPIVNFFLILVLLIIFSTWLNLTVSGSLANWKTIEVLNENIKFYSVIQKDLDIEFDFSQIEYTLNTYHMIIDGIQQRYYNMLIFLPILIGMMIFAIKSYNLSNLNTYKILIKNGETVFPIMFTAFFAMSMVFFSSSSGMEVSNNETINILLSELFSSDNPNDVSVLIQKFIFDNSQDYHKELVNAFYFAGIGSFFLGAYFVQIIKGETNVISSLIFYSAIAVLLYWFIIFEQSIVHDSKEFVPSMFSILKNQIQLNETIGMDDKLSYIINHNFLK